MAYVTNEEGYNDYQSDAEVMYHISDTYLGRKPLLTPRIPRVAKASGENIRTKRICVSPSIEQCVLGIDGVSYMESSSLEVGKSWYVYQTTKKGNQPERCKILIQQKSTGLKKKHALNILENFFVSKNQILLC